MGSGRRSSSWRTETCSRGSRYSPFPVPVDHLDTDLPHTHGAVATQLRPTGSGPISMRGFVQAYFEENGDDGSRTPAPMGFMKAEQVPVSSFLARSFATCDRWFAPLPTGTQPNKLMALTGECRIQDNAGLKPPRGKTILEWADDRVKWRVYHAGLSFFALLGQISDVAFGPFRDFDRLEQDVLKGDLTPLVLVEPWYGDADFLGIGHPNDNHPPTPMRPGEEFLARIYGALTGNPKLWAKTVLIVTYDEPGGFYDHFTPLPIPYTPPPGSNYSGFATTGPRVPGLVISPLVAAGKVYSDPLDHTSILRFVAERFTPGIWYSDSVEKRRVDSQAAGAAIHSVADVLDFASPPRTDIPALPALPPPPPQTVSFALRPRVPRPGNAMQATFEAAALEMMRKYPKKMRSKHPELVAWHEQRGG